MPASLRPLSTGQLLDRTFQTYRQNFMLFAGISALPNACVLVLQLALLIFSKRNGANSAEAAIAAGIFALGFLLVNLIVTALSTAATTFGVSDIYLEKTTSISACFARVKGKLGRVIYTSLELGLRVGIGFILLIVPGVYWGGKYGLAVPAVVLEDIKAKQAFPRSAALTKDAIGRIIAIYFLTWILTMVVVIGLATAVQAVAPALAKSAGTITAAAFNLVLNAIVVTAITPIMAIALTLAYYDQRVRKEAFDIENLMNLLGQPSAVPAVGSL
jgi:predicted secreted protein